MEVRDRLGSAVVAMLIGVMWTALLFLGVWLAFSWAVQEFGRDVAVVSAFALGGVVLAVVLWIASSRHTAAIWRSALSFSADVQAANVDALRSLSGVQREDAKAFRIQQQAQAQIAVAAYRAALTDSRRQETATQTTWGAQETEDATAGDSFRWVE